MKIPTGIEYLNTLIGGGQLPSGVHGLLGPIGGGKTMLASMVASTGARLQHDRALDGQPAGRWIFVTVKDHPADILRLMRSQTAQGSEKVLPTLTASSCDGATDGTSTAIEKYLHIVDLSGCIRFGLYQDPAQLLSDEVSRVAGGGPVAGVVLDDVGGFVTKYMDCLRMPPEKKSYEIRCLVEDVRALVAEPFNCPVWLVHLLSGSASSKSPATVQSHRDAADCRHFGKHLDVCVCLGRLEPRNRSLLLTCSKAPLTELPPPALLTIDAQSGSFIAVKDEMDPINRMRRALLERANTVACDEHTSSFLARLNEHPEFMPPQRSKKRRKKFLGRPGL